MRGWRVPPVLDAHAIALQGFNNDAPWYEGRIAFDQQPDRAMRLVEATLF